MSVDAQHIPANPRPVPTPTEAALEALAHTREATLFTQTAVEKLERLFARMQTPPELRPIQLTQAAPIVTDKSKWEALSIGIVNPTVVPVMLGVGGSSPTINAKAPQVNANSILLLPVRAYDLEIGVDPSQQANIPAGIGIVLQLLRFPAVQATYYAKLA